MSGDKALVIGGTGKVGGHIVQRFIAAGRPVRSASRTGGAPQGAEAASFDWFSDATHDAALADIGAVFMVAPIGSSEPVSSMEPFIDRAIASGVRRFVLLSSSLIDEGGPLMGAVHAVLKQRAPEWAVLRPSWFMENFTIDPHLSSIRFENLVYSATGDGRVPFIAARDIAEAAFRTMTDSTPVNDGLVLTGPELLTYADVARIVGDARGVPVRHHELSADELAARLESFGIPGPFATTLAQLDQAIAAGAENRLTPAVEELTGQAPVAFADFVAERPGLWSPPT